MKTRAELLAELEEKRLENNNLQEEPEVITLYEYPSGYDPYDHPGLSRDTPADADPGTYRRSLRQRRR